MSSASRAWIVAASIGAVEALKDQGICRWNHAFRSVQQQAKKSIGSFAQAKRLSPAVTSTLQKNVDGQERLKQSEESLRKVMYLSCWGPN
ncbi:hypothetical protein ACLOJK_039789 [Asimina triloba]